MKAACSRDRSRNGDSGSSTRYPPHCAPRTHGSPRVPLTKRQAACIALAVLALSGCVTPPATRQNDPTNAQLQLDNLHDRDARVNALLDDADTYRASYQYDLAVQALGQAYQIDPTSERGRKIGAALDRDRRDLTSLQEADRMMQRGSYSLAEERVHRVLAQNPTNPMAQQMLRDIQDKRNQQRALKEEKITASSIMRTPVTLQFRDANVRMVFEALSKTTGLNVIFDRDVRADLKTTIFVTNATLQDTVDMILMQSQLDKKQLNANTLFIYPATPAKELEYQELKVRTFQLSNVDAKQIQGLLKSLLKLKEVVVDERSNTVTIRGTPDTIRVAEEMIAAQDIPEPEVMMEVQVLEVSHDRMTDLGIEWPNTFTMSTPATANTWGELHHLPINALNVSGLSATANFKLSDTDANLLASPRIRARNKEKARILIGDKVPVISSSSTPSTSGPSYTQMVQYLDVGIKLEVEPQVYRDGDVGIKLNLEVSNITKVIQSDSSQAGLTTLAYQIGTRNASTSLRLRDGETQILGGLISDQDRTTADKVPGLGQLPVLGRLFSNHNGDHVKTEIVLQITPHIVRPQVAADADTQEVWSGTDVNVHSEQLRLDPVVAELEPAVPRPVVRTPGNVGGGTTGGAAATPHSSTQGRPSTQPPASAFGQLPPAPRTAPPQQPYGGRYSTLPAPPVQPVPPANGATAPADQAAAEAQPGGESGNGNGYAPQTPSAAPGAQMAPPPPPAPALSAPSAPPSNLVMPPGDMPSDNPLRPIQNGGY
ncbi:secretin N-terminal domain-containing protein [Paraburkholderia caribensis]|uniref:General secretion pathway protein GspD n=1 Tax=Paraburkholderia caribensis TaxID=75105 RepID=A0A9Q6SA11_9BURK|nr:secretin N-terminal domain-containing protein [Paraburkholderia caribensis]MCO4877397.1 secretin and TonB N-terminal domain-containing protein [Paraburkholderia caribensis]PTB29915.1 general secretion pathway protein GspD [Paraburkholderia caribensis]QLB67198.1 general secretion pathway protein GspD [Paraburkholderia caribensis]